MPSTRTFKIKHQRDLRPEADGLDWRLLTFGAGHWCVGNGHSGTFRSEAAADEAGRIWVETGLCPAEQTPDRIERQRNAARAGEAKMARIAA